MKQVIMKRLLIAGIAVLTLPSTLLAQVEKEEKKEKKEFQQIIITRTGEKDEKITIEVDGDKVKVNGKDVKDLKDVNVHVNKIKTPGIYRMGQNGSETWSYNFNEGDHMSLFSEDENRAMLGVTTEGHDKGAEIKSITKESGAEKAGLQKGDIITKIGDMAIESTDDVTEAVRAQKPGDKVNITVLRNGKEQKLTAELGKWKGIKMNAVSMPRIAELPQWRELVEAVEPPAVFGPNGFNHYLAGRPKLGLSIQDTDEGKGVKILEVDDDSNAAKAGLRKDDLILSVDDKEIKGTEDISRIIRENKDKYNFKVQRDGKTQNIEVKMPRRLKTTDL